MYASMTIGTLRFLKQFSIKRPKIDFFYMKNLYENSFLVFYEHKRRRSVFAAGKTYQIIETINQLNIEGFVIMETLPITKDGQPLFEQEMKKKKKAMQKMPGFLAFRLLRPRRGHDYIVMSQWNKMSSYDKWKENEQETLIKQPAYFASRPFTTSYIIVDLEDDETKNK